MLFQAAIHATSNSVFACVVGELADNFGGGFSHVGY